MQGGAQPHALNALVLGFVLRLRQHRRQALGGSFRQGPWCSHAKPPASASLPLFMIVRKRISISTTSLGWHLLGSGLHPTECDREAVGSLPEALGHFSGGDVGPLGPERSTVLGRRLSARPLVEWGTQKCRRHGNSPA